MQEEGNNTSILSGRLTHTFSALTHKNFRLFWFGQCISLIGTWMQTIGQSWLVLQITKSAFKLGIVNAMQFLPMMFLALFAGTLVDKYPKRKVLLITQTSLMILAVILASLTFFNVVQYWHILLLAILLGIVNTLDMPTRQAFFVELVGREDLMNAIALNSSIFNLARIIGPAVAGVLIGFLGIAVCFYLNALSFIAVIAGIWMIDIPGDNSFVKDKDQIKGTMENIIDGLKYIGSKPVILFPLVLLAITSTFVMNYTTLVPIYAKQNLGQEALGYGILMTSMGIGSLIGALTLAASSKTGPKKLVLLSGALGMSLFTAILGFTGNYIFACVLLMVVGFFAITFTGSVNSTIQLNSDDNMRGRVMSVFSLVFGGVTPIGSLYAGKLAESAGAPLCIAISGVIGIIASAAVWVLLYRNKK